MMICRTWLSLRSDLAAAGTAASASMVNANNNFMIHRPVSHEWSR
jgi:hypothetical protein